MRRWMLALSVLVLAALPAAAAPLDPALQQQLLGIYGAYNQAVMAGNIQAALATRSSESRTAMQQQLKTPKDQQDFLQSARTGVPDRVDVLHTSLNTAGDQATIVTVVSKTFPKGTKMPPGAPPAGTTASNELALHFVKNGANWAFDDEMWGPDPSKIIACRDDSVEPVSAYNAGKQVEMGGPISRVDFQPDHTLIVVRVVDQETCVLLPDRAALTKQGVNVAQLVPYTIVAIDGLAHKTKKDKMLGQKIQIIPDQ